MSQPKSKIKGALIILAVLCVPVGGGYLYWSSSGWTYSEGSRAGTVVKFSHKGNWTKTWEGELAMGSIEQGGQREKWEFSVYEEQDGEGICKQVEDAMDSGRRVKVHYRQQRGTQWWKGATEYFVTSVEYLGK
tara:strand:+ start:1116 stop:1514 length:399 start_codon:yes stop_codon:yes gene_type:complete